MFKAILQLILLLLTPGIEKYIIYLITYMTGRKFNVTSTLNYYYTPQS